MFTTSRGMQLRDWQKLIGNLFLVIAYISAFTCLLRSDYNFPFSLFAYYVWTLKPDYDSNKLLIAVNALLILFDIIWLASVGPIWTTVVHNGVVWNSFHGARVFNIILSSISVFVKLVCIIVLLKIRSNKEHVVGHGALIHNDGNKAHPFNF